LSYTARRPARNRRSDSFMLAFSPRSIY